MAIYIIYLHCYLSKGPPNQCSHPTEYHRKIIPPEDPGGCSKHPSSACSPVFFFGKKKKRNRDPTCVCSIRVCKLPLRGEVLTRLFVQVFFDLGWDLFWGFCCFSRTCTRSPQNVPKALKTASPALFSQLCNHNFRHWPTGNETASMSPANFSTSSLWRLLWPHRFFSDIKSMRKNPVQSC